MRVRQCANFMCPIGIPFPHPSVCEALGLALRLTDRGGSGEVAGCSDVQGSNITPVDRNHM